MSFHPLSISCAYSSLSNEKSEIKSGNYYIKKLFGAIFFTKFIKKTCRYFLVITCPRGPWVKRKRRVSSLLPLSTWPKDSPRRRVKPWRVGASPPSAPPRYRADARDAGGIYSGAPRGTIRRCTRRIHFRLDPLQLQSSLSCSCSL